MNYKKMKCEDIKEYIKNNSQINLDETIKELYLDERKTINNLAKSLKKQQVQKNKEKDRIKAMYDFDRSYGLGIKIAGTDEVGRGPLAGPIVGAAVILDLSSNYTEKIINGINDSKKLTENQRNLVIEGIKEKAIDYSIFAIDNIIIDKNGISWSNNEVMKQSCLGLKIKPDLILSDGYTIKNISITNHSVIKGDTKSASIACASIIAKVYRDNLMKEYSKKYSLYDFQNNVGYGTKIHIESIKKYGICEIHRKSFLRNIL